MRIKVSGSLPSEVTPKDVVLVIIGEIGTAAGTGYAIEFAGSVFASMGLEGRMTVCNMVIEAGARSHMMAVDDKTIDYFTGRPFAPAGSSWDDAIAEWTQLYSDEDAVFDLEITLRGEDMMPLITWGKSPEMVMPISAFVPDLEKAPDEKK